MLFNPALGGHVLLWAAQSIQFKLDRKGAELKSGVDVRTLGNDPDDGTNVYPFDGPFLSIM
jgi:hypothetical protein